MKTAVPILVLVALLVGVAAFAGEEKPATPSKKTLVVGIYDSRAIAVAYAPSEWNRKYIEGVKARMEGAKAENDVKKMRRINEEMVRRQTWFHLMTFGTDSVKALLEPVKDRLPALAKEHGVDLVVSRWEIAWQNSDLEVVDLTLPMVKLYNPSEKTLGHVELITKNDPVPRETLLRMKDHE
jgi:hypothetical protein